MNNCSVGLALKQENKNTSAMVSLEPNQIVFSPSKEHHEGIFEQMLKIETFFYKQLRESSLEHFCSLKIALRRNVRLPCQENQKRDF